MSLSKKTVLRDYYPSGSIRLESELNRRGVPDGACRVYFENGVLKELSTRKDGKLWGEFAQWSEDGKLLGSFVLLDGNGTHKHWYPDGRLGIETEYKEGLTHGLRRMFDAESGKCVRTEYYWKGKKVSKKKFDELNGTS